MAIDTDSRVIIRTIAALKRGISYKLHQGGTSSGKTFGILYALLFFALKYMRAGSVVSVVGLNFPHLKRGALRDFKNIIRETGLAGQVVEDKTNHIFHLPRGIKFEFFAVDDEQKARSGKRDYLFMNECNSIDWSIAEHLMMRTAFTSILDWNPSGKFWLHFKLLPFLQAFEYVFTRSTYRDNKEASKKIIDKIERLKLSDPVKYQIYGLGLEGKGKEIIFPVYEIVDSFPETDRVATGQDFGFTNHPSVGLLLGYYNGGIYLDELFYETGLSNKDINDRYRAMKRKYGRITADSAEPKSISELKGYGLDIVPAVKGPDSIKYGIDQLKLYPLYVTKQSQNVIDELDGYKWLMVNGEPTNKPDPKCVDHAMDAGRYGYQGLFANVIPMQPQVRRATEMGFTGLG